MSDMSIGITPAGAGLDGIAWSILGQTYVPKQHSPRSFSWHATFPPGTFVPPHVHPHQDEFVYMLSGRLDVLLNGAPGHAVPGDLLRLPQGVPHGLFNKGAAEVKCLFWVSPAGRLFDLFWALHNLGPDPAIPAVVAIAAAHEVDFLPPPADP